MREKYIREKSQVERQSAEAQSKSDEKLRQTLALTLKRLETYQKVIFLHFSLQFKIFVKISIHSRMENFLVYIFEKSQVKRQSAEGQSKSD